MSLSGNIARTLSLRALIITGVSATAIATTVLGGSAGSSQRDPPGLPQLVTSLGHATVRIASAADRCSGVIVSTDGSILTVAHGLSPGTEGSADVVTVFFSDGTSAAAEVIFRDTHNDVALVRLKSPLKTPLISIPLTMSDSTAVTDDIVLAAGYPGRESNGKSPVVRIGRVVHVDKHSLRTTCSLTTGDSGGPLIGRFGNLLGLHRRIGLGADNNHHISASTILNVLQNQTPPTDAISDTPLKAIRNEATGTRWIADVRSPPEVAANELRRLTVDVLIVPEKQTPAEFPGRPDHGAPDVSLEQRRCQGTLLSESTVVTKLSELDGCRIPVCRTTDGTRFDAKVVQQMVELDVAILKLARAVPGFVSPRTAENSSVPASDTGQGSSLPESRIGFLVFSHVDNSAGVITREDHKEAPQPALLGAVLAAKPDEAPGTKPTLVVQDVIPNSASAFAGLQPGDSLTGLNHSTPHSLDDVGRLLEKLQPGDWMEFEVRRSGRPLQCRGRLQADPADQFAKVEFLDGRSGQLSSRRTGFAGVLQHDLVIGPEHCGGPLVDSSGRLVGINIARRARESTLAIPIDRVERMIAELSNP